MGRLVSMLLSTAVVNVAYGGVASPLEKVTSLLTELRAKVSQEGSQEAATYNKFACFCKDTIAAKTSAVSSGEVSKNDLQARLTDASTRREQEDASIRQNEQDIATLEGEILQLRKDRHSDALIYAKSEVDLTRALQGLTAAIQMLKSAKTSTGLLELSKVGDTLRQAVSMAEALAPESTSRVLSMLSTQGANIPSSVYSFHADDIIATLEGLQTQFRTKKTDLDDQETLARQSFESTLQSKEAAVASHKTALESHQRNKAAEAQAVAQASQDLTATSAQLLDDQRYLTELSGKCQQKAVAWDERTQARENELVAMTRALDILQAMSAVPSPGAASMVQLQTARAAEVHDLLGGAARATLAAVSSHSPSLVQLDLEEDGLHQLRSRLRGSQAAAPATDWRKLAAALLRTKAGNLHSALLLRVAAQVTADPFAKVKTLIQELIERLLKEAQSEANHKGWCDKQVTLAEEARDRSADSITEVNARLEMGEARRAKLTLSIQNLDEELHSINTTILNSTSTREQEKAQNAAAIQDAKLGRDAVAKAMDILDKFYKEAANNATSFVELEARGRSSAASSSSGAAPGSTVDEDLPSAGFDGDYAGAVGAKEGILGLLDVIKSDFERTISETTKDEAKAAEIYEELQRTAGASLAAKTEVRASEERSLRDADSEDQDDRGSLAKLQATLDQALTELGALHSSCVDSGMSAEERKIQRDQEMDALKKVLCILEQHGVGGIDSC